MLLCSISLNHFSSRQICSDMHIEKHVSIHVKSKRIHWDKNDSLQFVEKVSAINSHENPSRGSGVSSRIRTDVRTEGN
jgi:hypothetical protein